MNNGNARQVVCCWNEPEIIVLWNKSTGWFDFSAIERRYERHGKNSGVKRYHCGYKFCRVSLCPLNNKLGFGMIGVLFMVHVYNVPWVTSTNSQQANMSQNKLNKPPMHRRVACWLAAAVHLSRRQKQRKVQPPSRRRKNPRQRNWRRWVWLVAAPAS